jgi:calcineurin-like phosphoesterase family protein
MTTGNLFARQTWFTADLHLGHEKIIELCDRPFATVDEMNTTIIEKWNERVDPGDTVWVLGDFATRQIKDALPLAACLHGRKILVAGDHDPCFHGYIRKSQDSQTLTYGDGSMDKQMLAHQVDHYRAVGFSSVVTGKAARKRTGRPVVVPLRPMFGEPSVLSVQLSHFPRAGDSDPSTPDRYLDYRPRTTTSRAPQPWLLHGDVHRAWTVNGRQVNVGVDVWDYAPVSAETLLSVIREGMPPCDCSGESHPAGSPGCAINGC